MCLDSVSMVTKKLTKAGGRRKALPGGDCVDSFVDLRCRLGDDCKLFNDMVLVWCDIMLIVSSSSGFVGCVCIVDIWSML